MLSDRNQSQVLCAYRFARVDRCDRRAGYCQVVERLGLGFLNLDAAERLPICECLRTKDTRVRCMQMMTGESKYIVDDAVNGKKPLHLFGGLEPSHLPLHLVLINGASELATADPNEDFVEGPNVAAPSEGKLSENLEYSHTRS